MDPEAFLMGEGVLLPRDPDIKIMNMGCSVDAKAWVQVTWEATFFGWLHVKGEAYVEAEGGT